MLPVFSSILFASFSFFSARPSDLLELIKIKPKYMRSLVPGSI